jgi:hypothetical protein
MTASRHFQRISRRPFEQEATKSPSAGAMRQTGNKSMVGRSEPWHRCVTHSRNQEDTKDTEGHDGLRNCVQEDTEGTGGTLRDMTYVGSGP